MRIALFVGVLLGFLIAAWSDNYAAWTFAWLACASSLGFGLIRKHLDTALLITSLLLIMCGFGAFYIGIVTMTDISIMGRSVNMFAPIVLIFFATLLLCMGMVEQGSRSAVEAVEGVEAVVTVEAVEAVEAVVNAVDNDAVVSAVRVVSTASTVAAASTVPAETSANPAPVSRSWA
ncbi:hypothetical protein IDAT_10140 [Pseudidiomarina atlantica]|uniref:Uncharacterized protein n=1 Tax=Pseudidiomarina atlantica TaxID=1517416 RepID=A0A094ILZ3_9GAMM|nr:hypothetical protein [Pseudidiomarina atlantica]KFZ28192.1 hypothetical protein IDAT_10140 [Pseudidiomarina atlantica]